LVVARGGRYAVRDAFARVAQICMLVNMEDENGMRLSRKSKKETRRWRGVLSEDERRRARALVRG